MGLVPVFGLPLTAGRQTRRPDHYDLTGAAICLIGVAVIMYAPRH